VRLQAIRETRTERDLDVVRTLVYRSELFGWAFSEALQRVMRGPSDWSVGERELFAAFVSARNQCPF
jgi:hypothetical protein